MFRTWISQHTTVVFCHVLNGLKISTGMCDVTLSCDSHIHIPNSIASIVVTRIPEYGDRWLAKLLAVCNHEIAV